MHLPTVAIVLLAAALPLVRSKDTCDNLEMKVGNLGPMLRVNVHIKDCQADGSCVSWANLSLTRGEQFRDTDDHLSMMWWGAQVCTVHGRLTEGTKIRNFRCTSACHHINFKDQDFHLELDKEATEICTSDGNGTDCTIGKRKSYWDVRFTEAVLSGANTTSINKRKDFDSKKQCSAIRENPTSGVSFTLTFADCINVTSESGKRLEEHRCDFVDVVDEASGDSRQYLPELLLNLGQRYEHLVMVGQDAKGQRSYGHDNYFTAWNAGNTFCVGGRVVFRKMYKVKDFSNKVQDTSEFCMNSCGEKVNKNPVTTMYYEQKWDAPKGAEFEVVKYIKMHVSEDGNGGGDGNGGDGNGGDGNGGNDNFGTVVQSKAIVVLAFVAVAMFLGIAN